MLDARTVFRGLLLVAVVAVSYAAFRQSTWYAGRSTDAALRRAFMLADSMNAGIDEDDVIAKATVNGKLDVGKLRQLLLPAAKNAAELKRLEAELKAIAEGSGIREDSRPPMQPPSRERSRQTAAAAPPSPAAAPPPPQVLRPQIVVTPDPPPPVYRVEAAQGNWAVYDGPIPLRHFLVKAVGVMRGPPEGGKELIVPDAPRFAPMFRLCRDFDCHLTAYLRRVTGAEYSADICEQERGAFNRMEIWYNDYAGSDKAGREGSFDFSVVQSEYACSPVRRLCLDMVQTGLNKPSTCR